MAVTKVSVLGNCPLSDVNLLNCDSNRLNRSSTDNSSCFDSSEEVRKEASLCLKFSSIRGIARVLFFLFWSIVDYFLYDKNNFYSD
mmetsp:Transcript_21901/g.30779  ORF Transcript_21901/g.30779 Transcript_21901/m.30779 type:complete len:86 (-) Transcript_21901:56-313(-)